MPKASKIRPERPKEPWELNSTVFDAASSNMTDMTRLTSGERAARERAGHRQLRNATEGTERVVDNERSKLAKSVLHTVGEDGLTPAQRGNRTKHKDRDEFGRSMHTIRVLHTVGEDGLTPTERGLKKAMETLQTVGEDGLTPAQRNGQRLGRAVHREKTSDGKSKHALKAFHTSGSDGLTPAQHGAQLGGEAVHSERTPKGKSKHAMRVLHTPGSDGKTAAQRGNETMHREKGPDGKSKHAVAMGKSSQFNQSNTRLGDIIDLDPPSPEAGPSGY